MNTTPPYTIGQRIRALYNTNGTVLGMCTVTRVRDHHDPTVNLPAGQWRIDYRPDHPAEADRGHDYAATVTSTGKSDFISTPASWNTYQSPRLPVPPAECPPLYAQDGKGKQATVWAHYFGPGLIDTYVTEWDPETGETFGWAELVPGGGELGYGSMEQLNSSPLIDHDDYWTPQPLAEALADRDRRLGLTTSR